MYIAAQLFLTKLRKHLLKHENIWVVYKQKPAPGIYLQVFECRHCEIKVHINVSEIIYY